MKHNWEIKRIGEITTVIAGQSPEGKYYNTTGKGLPFYQGKKEFTDKFIGAPSTWTADVTKEAEKDDILMSVRAPVGPVNFSTERICIGRGLAAIRTSKQVDKDYLFNFLVKHENEIVGNAGAVFNSISKTQIEDIQIPIPPLPEQKRIVAILDEAFAAIDKAKANAEKNLANAREVFDSYLNSVFSSKGEGWEEKKLGEVCEFINGRAYKKEELLKTGKYPVLRVGNFFTNDQWYYSDLELDPDKYCDNGDLLYAWSASFGPRIWQGKKVIYHYHIWKVKPKLDTITKQFLFNLLEWDTEQIKVRYGTGTTMTHVGKGSIESREVFIPPLTEQKQIVAKIDELVAQTKRLEEIYKQKIADLDELKKSILDKAFKGEL